MLSLKRILIGGFLVAAVLGGMYVEHAIESRDLEIAELTQERNKLSDFLQVTEQALVASQDANELLLKRFKSQEQLLLEATQKRRVAVSATSELKKNYQKVIEYEQNTDWANAKLPDDIRGLLDSARSAEDNRVKAGAVITTAQFVRARGSALVAD